MSTTTSTPPGAAAAATASPPAAAATTADDRDRLAGLNPGPAGQHPVRGGAGVHSGDEGHWVRAVRQPVQPLACDRDQPGGGAGPAAVARGVGPHPVTGADITDISADRGDGAGKVAAHH
ncbi:MAG TPA: hypothetical protein VFW50_46160 [Streptosporangiaceae bacterium]|nr:hypothetical protein [Streptosporangiaceae bacterium]